MFERVIEEIQFEIDQIDRLFVSYAVLFARVQQLDNYLGFRHFYRHSYSFFLDWSQLEKLVIPVEAVWSQAKAELTAFLDHLNSP